MCKDCKEINIPQGPIGPQGPVGSNGNDGTNGTNGNDGLPGINGTTILTNLLQGNLLGRFAETNVVTSLYSYTLPANNLSTNGDEIEIELVLKHYGDTDIDPVELQVKLGTEAYSEILSWTDGEEIIRKFNIKITRINQNVQFWTIQHLCRDLTAPLGPTVNFVQTINFAQTIANLAATQLIDITVNKTNLALHKATVYKYSI